MVKKIEDGEMFTEIEHKSSLYIYLSIYPVFTTTTTTTTTTHSHLGINIVISGTHPTALWHWHCGTQSCHFCINTRQYASRWIKVCMEGRF